MLVKHVFQFFVVSLIGVDAFCFSAFYRSSTLPNRSLPLPTIADLVETEDSPIKWEEGEVSWEIENMKNITLQPMKGRPTPFPPNEIFTFFLSNL